MVGTARRDVPCWTTAVSQPLVLWGSAFQFKLENAVSVTSMERVWGRRKKGVRSQPCPNWDQWEIARPALTAS